MVEYRVPDPADHLSGAREVARELVVIPHRPGEIAANIGLIGGADAVLVVETGLGPQNATALLRFADEYAHGRRLYLTTTHFHPEHAFGAQAFTGTATYLINKAQAEDLTAKGPAYLEMFKGLDEEIARQLEGVELATPDIVYDESYELDLGGRIVRLSGTGRAHTRGDQIVTVPDAGVMFTGDLVEAGQFAIFPWFPPHDADVSGTRWISVVERLIAATPRVVVPGHGDVGGVQLLVEVRDYLEVLRAETWKRRDSGMNEQTIADELSTLMTQRRPDWIGREWIANGVGCFCAEHRAADESSN